MKDEPVMSLVVALVAAGVGVLAAFGVDITDAQKAAIGGFAAAALALGLYVRSRVTPTGAKRKSDAGLTLLEVIVILLVVAVVLILIGAL